MALAGGSVAVNVAEDGLSYAATGSGLAKAMFDVEVTLYQQDPDLDYAGNPYPPPKDAIEASQQAAAKDSARKGNADTAARAAKKWNALAPALVAYIKANAEVTLSGPVATIAAGTSLGTTPTPNNPATAIVGPVGDVTLPVTGTGTIA